MSRQKVENLIPHRPPFLWVDHIVESEEGRIVTEKLIPADLPLFAGHYPGRPIFPGVLLCEAMFQSGALLMAGRQEGLGEAAGLPLVTRILGAKFKRPVYPGDLLRMTVTLTERMSTAYTFHGVAKVSGKTVATVDFICMLHRQAEP